ncbi:MAG TPA: vWA domain-containing protein [Labilithrix sp.]|nr:vWA domain-containing protein [Labilithrix sp.]
MRLVPCLSSMMVGAALFAGCGLSGDSTFADGTLPGGGNGPGGGFGESDGDGDGDGDGGGAGGNGNGSSGGVGEVGNVDPNSACATASDGAVLQPISLVFMIDRSRSMVQSGARATRWDPVRSGLQTFFADPKSSTVSASLSFFPILPNMAGGRCQSTTYETPVVEMTQLPNLGAFSNAFKQEPDGTTPTRPALKGALFQAKAEKETGKNVAVVLATDGQPNGCSAEVDDIESVKDVAADGLKDGIRTYVIGVGPSTGNLDGMAQSGGTGKAILIPTNNAAQVSADLIAAVGQIASSLLGCNFGLPAPPAGQTLDVNAVNVNYTPPGGASKTLAYSADCSNPNGWHYDSTTAPKEIILCNAACEVAQAQLGAKLDIIFGCATEVPEGGMDPSGNVR